KPFALMARSVDAIRLFCKLTDHETELLQSPARPIVLLEKRRAKGIPRAVAPGVNKLGFMLPYAPLHHLLFESFEQPLVMTSGNLSDEPIRYRDDEAVQHLKKIADY